MPKDLKDVAGIKPTTHPELHGKVTEAYWRRPFGLGKADAGAVAELGGEFDKMLKPGGFIEFRVLPAADAKVAQRIAAHIPGSRTVEVPQRAIDAYYKSLDAGVPKRPPALSNEQWSILEGAGSDLLQSKAALGKGVFNRIIRIYKPSAP